MREAAGAAAKFRKLDPYVAQSGTQAKNIDTSKHMV